MGMLLVINDPVEPEPDVEATTGREAGLRADDGVEDVEDVEELLLALFEMEGT